MSSINRLKDIDPSLFCVSPEVADALRSGRPIVALESTIITHGLPFPTNFETAIAAEGCIREHGALPATIAIVEGVVHIGASQQVCHVLLFIHMFDTVMEVLMHMAKLGKAADKVRSNCCHPGHLCF